MSLREGSAHEEEALVAALKEIVTSVDNLQDDVKRLLPVLVQFGFNKEAAAVQSKFAEVLDSVRQNLEVIWPSDVGESSMLNPADALVCVCVCSCSKLHVSSTYREVWARMQQSTVY